ncbi:MAG TPA: ribulose-phosphate 3-epimerase [Candidatus Babeliales bacterium]|jgi:ribulose-phosphate 3-epimerase|nr:ribulose-phosphate 3-epimerase [Candidatus Babeliales bacterium]
MVNIYPSLMAANPLRLENEIHLLEPYCAGFHLDVMDNHFVPNITWGAQTVNAIAQMGKLVWVHLMVEKPDIFYDTLILPVDSIVSIHIESEIDIFSFAKIVREKKHKVSIAISPKTPILRLVPFLDMVDQVLLMSVEPGFSGQHFLQNSFDRLRELVEYRRKHDSLFRIGCDGGIDITNINMVVETGVDDCAIATAIFQQQDHVAALQQLYSNV